MGDVYLMYNSATGNNCAVTLKAVAVGSTTGVAASLPGGGQLQLLGHRLR
ncbi:hypothetical protein AB0C02_26740 [Micromonospora sp. NPDC048999]